MMRNIKPKSFIRVLVLYIILSISPTKIRLSERNAKEKFIFLFIPERKYHRPQVRVRLSERNAKEKFIFLFIPERKYLRPQVRGTIK